MTFIWFMLFLLGLIVMAAEAFVFTFGVLAFIGAVLFFVGLAMLPVGGMILGFMITAQIIAGLGLSGLIILMTVVYFAVKAYSRRPKPIIEGEHVDVLEWDGHKGRVRLKGGEIWQAVSNKQFNVGDIARITAIDNLILTLE